MNHATPSAAKTPGPSCPTEQRLQAVERKLDALCELLKSYSELPPVDFTEHRFATNFHVRLEGQTLWVGSVCAGLDRNESILVGLLIQHALERGPEFMTVQDLIEEIGTRFRGFWPEPLKKEIYDTIHSARQKLGQRRHVIETGKPRCTGYRISTPRSNISLPRDQRSGQPGRAA